jgi:hypothetical protein
MLDLDQDADGASYHDLARLNPLFCGQHVFHRWHH